MIPCNSATIQSDSQGAFIDFEGHVYRHSDLEPHVGSTAEVSTFVNMSGQWTADVYFHTGNTPSGQECVNDIVES